MKASVSGYKQISEGFMGSKSYTVYELETKSNIPKYDPDQVYRVNRRFSDFEWLLQVLQEKQEYKGYIIPPLP